MSPRPHDDREDARARALASKLPLTISVKARSVSLTLTLRAILPTSSSFVSCPPELRSGQADQPTSRPLHPLATPTMAPASCSIQRPQYGVSAKALPAKAAPPAQPLLDTRVTGEATREDAMKTRQRYLGVAVLALCRRPGAFIDRRRWASGGDEDRRWRSP
jgi:hypothetical protein